MTGTGAGGGPSAPARTAKPAADERPLLELRDVQLSYGPYRALFGVSLTVPERCAVALVGPNGAGKTSIARVVSGLVRPSGGAIVFDGNDVGRWPAWRIARAGLAHVSEGRSVFSSLSVEENLQLAVATLPARREQAAAIARAYEAFGRLGQRRHQTAGTLSGGEQRMLALARVLVLPRRLVVVDELSLGLAPALVDEIFDALRTITAGGTSLLVVEQHVDRVLALAERLVVLVRGRVIAEGPTGEIAGVLPGLLAAHTEGALPEAETPLPAPSGGAEAPPGGAGAPPVL